MGLLDDLKNIKVDSLMDLPVVSAVSKVTTNALASISQPTPKKKYSSGQGATNYGLGKNWLLPKNS